MARQHPDARHGPSIHLDAPAALRIQGDADLLHRAIFNLVLNALQHSDDGGEVRVDIRAVDDRSLPPGAGFDEGVRLRVMDQGRGVAPDDLARVFDPFFTTRRGGSGLGLALVQRAVEAHEGVLFVDSELGEGTTFTLFLPTRLRQGAP